MRRPTHPRGLSPAAACVVALSLLYGACGAQDDGRIRAVVTEAFTSRDPSVCTQLMTQAYVEQREYRRGRQAVTRDLPPAVVTCAVRGLRQR